MEKQELRERIWDELEKSGESRFPYPPHGRIPNFNGADEAAERLAANEAWQNADVIKSNPDSPQLPVRRAALRQGKTIYMAVPRLRDEKCFLRLDPTEVEDVDHATTIGGSSEVGVPVGPDEMEPVDLIVSGSVAVNEEGARVGKGEGYSDLEFAILREFGLVDDETTTVTTLHETQFVDEAIPTTPQDVPIEWVFTPERSVRTEASARKPSGIAWEEVTDERMAEIPILERLRGE
ncbi:5-formyltetrahydrofolate cyclo-ligase [Halogeometricum luteum]|uniref:5-formyltetrahydrofolate cyclo-ligase n=1 Tax=Halogeometricum luteum TaxID=2950537 RepID=A0ABU2G130_9EURY|nr:5-formyltetrahydrofolate cyclo-ligase [Halogeometricum sp. S3BR5-2]MDS0293998.1 5-formyltetrahydrofolate cyclo-ligase [Halogeometricum sp. S3BR5-2]